MKKKSFGNYLTSFDITSPCINKYKPASYKERKLEDEREVFHKYQSFLFSLFPIV